MQHISQIRTTIDNCTKEETTIDNWNKEIKTIDNCIDNKRIDYLLEHYKHLRESKDSAWHATVIRRLGLEKYEVLAKTALREGKIPARYMTWLINRDLKTFSH